MTTSPSRRELLAWALAVILAVSAVALGRSGIAGAGLPPPPGGAAGQTEVVYIATGANFPDALGAAATAAMGLGPVLLVQHDTIPAPTKTELDRLQPPRIVIVGGTAVVSAGVETQLDALAYTSEVTRIAGANRYETAANLSAATFPSTGAYPRVADETGPAVNLNNSSDNLATVIIDAPAPGFLVATANTQVIIGSATGFTCTLHVNGDPVTGSARGVTLTAELSQCATQGVVPVGAGLHEVTASGIAAGGALQARANLVVIWIPFDGFGAVPTVP